MREVFITADNIFSPLGSTSAENFEQLTQMATAVKKQENNSISDEPFFAALFPKGAFTQNNAEGPTEFEQLLIASVSDALKNSYVDPRDTKTILIVSSTKGNISLLEKKEMSDGVKERIALHSSAKLVAQQFHFANNPVVVSNACISGLLALVTGMRMLRSGQYDHAVITGADIITKFILSGFQSFQAISPAACRPFDANRNGINLGEGAATIILSCKKQSDDNIKITGGAISNDANHISGPSRTGEELCLAIEKAMRSAGVTAADIDLISAHGTATIYNDEMEAKAIHLAGLQDVPVNSLKGYYGHTLGAAGLIESVISLHSMTANIIIPTPGFSEMGVSQPLQVSSSIERKMIKHCLKTASGFGGCNAAVVFSKQ